MTESVVMHEWENVKEPVNVGSAERWLSAIAGGFMAVRGLRSRSLGGAALAAAGGYLLYRGTTGNCSLYRAAGISTAKAPGICMVESLTVNRPVHEVYAFWRNIENLPRFMTHLESVKDMGEGRSHWSARTPGGFRVEWDSVLTEARENEFIKWKSLPESDVICEGVVTFRGAPVGRGTEVRIEMEYLPTAGRAGEAAAVFIDSLTRELLREDLWNFKQVMEAGEVPTVEGQPSGAVGF